MCKCCQSCLETIWWHMIEKRFCFDDEIALYEVPETNQEKNNNIFENAVFYDSVSVIAGRSVVTIEPLPSKIIAPAILEPTPINTIEPSVIISQPVSTRISLPKFQLSPDGSSEDLSENDVPEKRLYRSTSDITETQTENMKVIDNQQNARDRNLEIPMILTESKSEGEMASLKKDPADVMKSEGDLSEVSDTANIDLRKKIFIEKRMSKSLYLNMECVGERCREIPIIRQNSMPKFYLGSPEDHQIETAVFRTPSTALACPIPAVNDNGFIYNLSSVVQMEKEKAFSGSSLPQVHDQNKRQFRDKIVKLRRIKSTMSAFQSHHM